MAPCGSPTRNNTIGRITTGGTVTNYTGTGIAGSQGDHERPGWRPVVHQLRQQLDRPDHHGRHGDQLHRHRLASLGDHERPGWRPVVHQRVRQLDRPDHHGRHGDHQLHRHRHLGPYGITSGPDGALWFTNSGNNSIGRITTGGTVTNYTGTGISGPEGITSGPDGALWFTNSGNNSIGRITTGGR